MGQSTLLNFSNTERVLMEYRDAVINMYRDKLLKEDHVASHHLMDDIKYLITKGNSQVEVSLQLRDYWKYVENDTKPHFPPIGNGDEGTGILSWVRLKHLIDKAEPYNGKLPTERQLAYLIARKISEEGTTGTHDLAETLQDVDRIYQEKIGEAIYEDLNDTMINILDAFNAK